MLQEMSINKEPKMAVKPNSETLEFEINGIYGYSKCRLNLHANSCGTLV